jgi:hypothetical protein
MNKKALGTVGVVLLCTAVVGATVWGTVRFIDHISAPASVEAPQTTTAPAATTTTAPQTTTIALSEALSSVTSTEQAETTTLAPETNATAAQTTTSATTAKPGFSYPTDKDGIIALYNSCAKPKLKSYSRKLTSLVADFNAKIDVTERTGTALDSTDGSGVSFPQLSSAQVKSAALTQSSGSSAQYTIVLNDVTAGQELGSTLGGYTGLLGYSDFIPMVENLGNTLAGINVPMKMKESSFAISGKYVVSFNNGAITQIDYSAVQVSTGSATVFSVFTASAEIKMDISAKAY